MWQMWLWNWRTEAGATLWSDLVAILGPAGETKLVKFSFFEYPG